MQIHFPALVTYILGVIMHYRFLRNNPSVFGADARFPIRYDYPKEFDNTELVEAKYDEQVEQFGMEMLYSFSIV